MDFLDPDYNRRHNLILIFGQILVGIAVLTAAILLVYKAYGYDVDRKTGEVVQNGLVYVDSSPSNATIRINEQIYTDKTNTRFTVPAGNYTLKVQKSGYRTWEKNFDLAGSDVERLTYPTLFVEKLEPQAIANDAVISNLSTQSPDRKFLLFAETADLTKMREYSLADLDRNTDIPRVRSITFPSGIFSTPKSPGATFEVVEWSNNNANFLVKHIFDGRYEYALLNRDEPTKSFSFATLGITEGDITLLDKSADTFLVLNKSTKVLSQYDLKDKKSTILLNNVVSYKSHEDNKIVYAHVNPSDSAKLTISILDDKKTYDIRDIAASDNVPLDIAGFQNKLYIVIGAEKESKSYIYEDFVKKYKSDALAKPGPIRVIRTKVSTPLVLAFSKNVRFISAFSGDDVSIYDIEKKRNYHYALNAVLPAGQSPVWMDGHRFNYVTNDSVWVSEFDGANKRELAKVTTVKNIFYDRDYNIYYTVAVASDGKLTLNKTNIKQKQDR
jgi:PEGA domain